LRALRLRLRSASPWTRRRRPAWRTCAYRRPRCAPWAAGGPGARRSPPRMPPAGKPMLGDMRVAAQAPSHQHASYAQVPQPDRRDGGGPALAAVLRLRHCALLLGGVPQGGLARGPQGCMPRRLPARARPACLHRRPVLSESMCPQGRGHACRPM